MKNLNHAFLFILGISLIICLPAAAIDIDTSSPFVYPEYSKKISMDFQNAALIDVLKIFSKQTNLNLVSSEEIANKRVTVYLDNVPVEQALTQILRANNLTYEIEPGTDIYIVKPIQKASVELVTRVYQLKHASVSKSKINTLITVTSEDGGSGSSSDAEDACIKTAIEAVLTEKGSINEDQRTNSLIVTDIAANFPIIEQTIARLDVPVAQILIEVEMLEVAKSIADTIGIEWGDSPLVFTGGIKETAFPFAGDGLIWEDPNAINYGADRITTGTMNATGLTATLQFLKSKTDTKNLARPRILTLNNQAAEIKITTDEAIGVQQETTSGGEGISSSSTEAERVETGVSLVVTPQANPETGIITLAVQPKVTIAKAGQTFGTSSFRDPEERSAKAILKIASGDTVIIGGLMREETTNIEKKVPIFGDLPVLGRLFRHTDLSSTERELIIFLTPHILPEPTDAATQALPKKLVREQDAP